MYRENARQWDHRRVAHRRLVSLQPLDVVLYVSSTCCSAGDRWSQKIIEVSAGWSSGQGRSSPQSLLFFDTHNG